VFFSSLLLLINCFLRVRLDLVCRPIFKLDLIVIVVHVSQQSPPGTTVVPWLVLLLTAAGEQMGAAPAAVDAALMVVLPCPFVVVILINLFLDITCLCPIPLLLG
jgi:hypothetical protein